MAVDAQFLYPCVISQLTTEKSFIIVVQFLELHFIFLYILCLNLQLKPAKWTDWAITEIILKFTEIYWRTKLRFNVLKNKLTEVTRRYLLNLNYQFVCFHTVSAHALVQKIILRRSINYDSFKCSYLIIFFILTFHSSTDGFHDYYARTFKFKRVLYGINRDSENVLDKLILSCERFNTLFCSSFCYCEKLE